MIASDKEGRRNQVLSKLRPIEVRVAFRRPKDRRFNFAGGWTKVSQSTTYRIAINPLWFLLSEWMHEFHHQIFLTIYVPTINKSKLTTARVKFLREGVSVDMHEFIAIPKIV